MTGVPAAARREPAEGERPGSGPYAQRWEAVFRRERRPVSLDRISLGGRPQPGQAWGKRCGSFSPCNL